MSDQLLRDAAAVLQPGFVNTGPGRAPDWVRRALAEDGLGGVAYYGRNIGATPAETASLSAALRAENPDVLVAVDEEGGDVTRLDVAFGSGYPGNYALGYVDDVALTEAVAGEIGVLLRRVGVNLNYAPDADVNTNPDNPVIGTRSFGASPDVASRHTAAYVRGLQSAGVAGCAKHFPGHGDTSVDTHVGLPRVDHSDAGWSDHLAPFRAAIAAGVKTVMTAHILAPAWDARWPSTMSRPVLTDLLRGELGFTGLVITDGIEMGAIVEHYGVVEGTVRAMAAGADAVCVGGGLRDEADYLLLRDALTAAVRDGRLDEARLHEAASRVRELGAWTRQRSLRKEGTDAASGSDRGGPAELISDAGLMGLFGPIGLSSGGAVGGSVAPSGGVDATDRESTDREPIGLTAARRALLVLGDPLKPLAGPAAVIEFSPAANNAAGTAVPWGLSPVLDHLPVGTTSVRFGRPGESTAFAGDSAEPAALSTVPCDLTAVIEAVEAAADRPIVLVARDLHRHAWMAEAVAAASAVRRDAIVVEMGVPYGLPQMSAGATLIVSHGAARVCGLAVAEALTSGAP